jgi:hypothetical protein
LTGCRQVDRSRAEINASHPVFPMSGVVGHVGRVFLRSIHPTNPPHDSPRWWLAGPCTSRVTLAPGDWCSGQLAMTAGDGGDLLLTGDRRAGWRRAEINASPPAIPLSGVVGHVGRAFLRSIRPTIPLHHPRGGGSPAFAQKELRWHLAAGTESVCDRGRRCRDVRLMGGRDVDRNRTEITATPSAFAMSGVVGHAGRVFSRSAQTLVTPSGHRIVHMPPRYISPQSPHCLDLSDVLGRDQGFPRVMPRHSGHFALFSCASNQGSWLQITLLAVQS